MRADGRRVKTVQPMYQVAAHIMADRCDSMNMTEVDIALEPIQKYLNEKRREGVSISHLGVVLAAFLRTLCEYPYLNRFVVNKTIYARNEVAIGMVVLKPGEHEGTMNKMYFDRKSTIFEVQQVIDRYIEENRAAGDTNSTDDLIRKLLSIPGLCRLGVNVFKWADKHGLLPKSIIDASPFHCTMTITNLASIRTNYIYHHVYNFGTTSMLMAMGNPRETPVRKKGEITFIRTMPLGVVMDERICNGSQYALAFKRLDQYLKNPALLELPPETVNEDLP
ncbi:MAG: 2-oxo acid dehydrogenase subunit E2 [Clostridia bacterium]|nr:2-oxo acid dehydrogenase subunit E2 [Clostridia bacterium]